MATSLFMAALAYALLQLTRQLVCALILMAMLMAFSPMLLEVAVVLPGFDFVKLVNTLVLALLAGHAPVVLEFTLMLVTWLVVAPAPKANMR